MFKPVKAKTVEEYIASLDPARRAQIEEIDTFIKKTVPALKPWFAYNMLGYGTMEYLNYKKETITWPVIAVASQKNYISLYVCSVVDGQYVAETHKAELGTVKVGKSCITFKKLDDINMDTLTKVLTIAEKHPTLQGVGASAKKK